MENKIGKLKRLNTFVFLFKLSLPTKKPQTKVLRLFITLLYKVFVLTNPLFKSFSFRYKYSY